MLDEDNYCYYGDNGMIPLTVFETALLGCLIENKSRIITYNELAAKLYNEKNCWEIRNKIRQILYRLSAKIDELEFVPFRRLGYKIRYRGGENNADNEPK